MGHASSVTSSNDFFGGKKIIEGSKIMAHNLPLRTCFVDFIKSGLWMESLGVEEVLGQNIRSHEDRLAIEHKNPIYAYKTSHGKVHDLDGMFQSEDDRVRGSSFESVLSVISAISVVSESSSNSKKSDNRRKHSQLIMGSFTEGYQSIEDRPFFSTQLLKHVMISICWPLFMKSEEFARYQQFGVESGVGSFTDDDCASSPLGEMDGGDKEHCKLTAASQHMQDLMLACAAYHDEVDLVEDLRQAQWTLHARGAIDDHAIALCVMDTNEGNVVYANKAFVELTGHNICAGLKVLAGKDTDSALQTELLEHISDSSPFKACLTHYTKSGRSFTDLVAIRPLAYPTGGSRKNLAGQYVLATLLPCTRLGKAQDLGCVDELLTIASYLVRPHIPLVRSILVLPALPPMGLSFSMSSKNSSKTYVSAKSSESGEVVSGGRGGGSGGKGGTSSKFGSGNRRLSLPFMPRLPSILSVKAESVKAEQ